MNGSVKNIGDTTELPNNKSLGDGEIVGIALCMLALVILGVGIFLAIRYHRIAKARKKSEHEQKQTDVKTYLETIPHYNNGRASSNSPQSSMSMSMSVHSKEHILPRSRPNLYRVEDDCHQV